jgi:hypothetical protein
MGLSQTWLVLLRTRCDPESPAQSGRHDTAPNLPLPPWGLLGAAKFCISELLAGKWDKVALRVSQGLRSDTSITEHTHMYQAQCWGYTGSKPQRKTARLAVGAQLGSES